jgi:hypothetical protein
MGIAMISRHTIGLEAQTGRLVELDVAGLPLMRRWYVVRRAGRFVSPATAEFVEFVGAVAPALLAEMHPPVKAAGRPAAHAARTRSRGAGPGERMRKV